MAHELLTLWRTPAVYVIPGINHIVDLMMATIIRDVVRGFPTAHVLTSSFFIVRAGRFRLKMKKSYVAMDDIITVCLEYIKGEG